MQLKRKENIREWLIEKRGDNLALESIIESKWENKRRLLILNKVKNMQFNIAMTKQTNKQGEWSFGSDCVIYITSFEIIKQ